MGQELQLRSATTDDIDAVVALVNRAYRPAADAAGWTHEAALVAGERINPAQLAQLLQQADSAVLLGCAGIHVVACVLVEKEEDGACMIGMLAVDPQLQTAGLGKRMLQHAEQFARQQFGAVLLRMVVISARSELLAFYLRRGYRRSGRQLAYPSAAGVGTPKLDNLQIEVLEKTAEPGKPALAARH